MSKIEEQFYEDFKINAVILSDFDYDTLRYNFKTVEIEGKRYPKITDKILLKLICIALQHEDFPVSTNMSNIQTRTLRILRRTLKWYSSADARKYYKRLITQVHKAFK